MFEFSVIIPVYKDTERLKSCLDRLIDQSFGTDSFEVIVVNNDPIVDLDLDSYYFRKLNLVVDNEGFPGSYAARNRGISIAQGRIVALTDSDCLPDRDWLLNAFPYFQRDCLNEIGILAGDVRLFFKNDERLSFAEVYEKYTGFTFEAYAKDGYCGAGNWFSYRSVMNEFGCFNPLLKSNGDTDLSGRISKKYQVVFAQSVIVYHPARYFVKDLVMRYRRLLGGVFDRKFRNRHAGFFFHILNFSWRRVRFSIKKFATVNLYDSSRIFVVCLALVRGAWQEYFHLIANGETRR